MDLAEGHVAAIQLLEEAQGSKEEDKEEVKKGGERNANVPVAYAGTVSTVNLGTGSGASVLQMVAAMETACECKVQFMQMHQHEDVASAEVNACVHVRKGARVPYLFLLFSIVISSLLAISQVAYQVAPRRPGDLSTVYAETAKAYDLLGWRAQRTLPEMAADLWRWQANNPQGYPPNATFHRDQEARNSGGRGPFRRLAAWTRRAFKGLKRDSARKLPAEL